METTSKMTVTLPKDTEIQLTREFDAPRDLVWKAFTTPELLRQWWGPHGTTLPVCELDLQQGGKWRFVIRNQDGSEHPFTGEFIEIAESERIVWTFIYDVPPFSEHASVETATFEELDGGRTLVTAVSVHDSKESRDAHLEAGMEQGAAQTYDRLEELLTRLG